MTFPDDISRRYFLTTSALLTLGGLAACHRPPPKMVRFGITPYQDSALPIVPSVKGWYSQDGINVQIVPLTWDQVIPALSGGAIDAAIYNFNSFIAPYASAALRDVKPLFYCPLYVFKGQAIMVHGDKHYLTTSNRGTAGADIATIARQLRGRRIAVTEGTELEQIVLATLSAGGLTSHDATIIHASPDESLAAFLSGNVDAFAAGLTERVEARRHGAIELVTQADVMQPVTDGLVTTDRFAASNSDLLDKIIEEWFRTVRYVGSNLEVNSAEIRAYLKNTASTIYSPEEYKIAWSFNQFPTDVRATTELFENPKSPFYWRTSWDNVNSFLIGQKKISVAAPYSAYTGTTVLARLNTSPIGGGLKTSVNG